MCLEQTVTTLVRKIVQLNGMRRKSRQKKNFLRLNLNQIKYLIIENRKIDSQSIG